MTLEFATLDALRTRHPAWRLLRSDHAPLVASFLQRVFIAPNVRVTRLPLFAANFPNFDKPRARKRLIDMAWSSAESAKHVVVPTFPLA